MSKYGRYVALALMTLGYIIGELAHFLIATTSPAVAKDLKYGDLACLGSSDNITCSDYSTEEECGVESVCSWDFSGKGLDFQLLAGPAFIVTFTFSALIMGVAADNINRPRLLAAAITVFSTCCILMGLSQEYWQLVVLRMGIAFGEAACRPASGSLIADFFPPESRATANGIFSWGVYFGYGLAFIFGIYVTEADIAGYGWRSSYVMAGVPGLVVALALFFVKDPRSEKQSEKPADSESAEQKPDVKSDSAVMVYLKSIKTAFWQPAMLCLLMSAAVRHTAGYSWANNNFNYFNEYHPNFDIGYWFTICSIAGGGCGVFFGGFLSDLIVKRLGIRSRLWLLGGFHILATPFAVLTLYLDPPYAFIGLMAYYFFAETWFAILFTVILEIVNANTRSITISTFLFIMNNLGGNLPVLIDPVSDATNSRVALYIFWPGLVFLSSLMFSASSFTIPKKSTEEIQ